MSVRVLAVEDDADDIDELQRIFEDIGRDVQVTYARSYASAVKALDEDTFDFVTLDLKLPANDEELDTDPANGMRVLAYMIRKKLGTPVIVLTGSPSEDHIDVFLRESKTADIWASGQDFSTIRFVKKNKFADILPLVADMAQAVRSLSDVEMRSDRINIPATDDRLIRILVRQRGGASYSLEKLGGGLSGADIYRLIVSNAAGAHVGSIIMKIGDYGMVDTEERNFGLHANRLLGAATPRLLGALKFGAGPRAAISYTLAEGFDRNAFNVAAAGGAEVQLIFGRLFKYLQPWVKGVPEEKRTVGDVRRGTLSDAKAASVIEDFNLDWVADFERRPVQLRWCSTHGDFHGGNILIDAAGNPTFIDYGDIGERAASFDWVSLELSLICHKDGPARSGSWPATNQCYLWGDLDEYLRDCPFADFIRVCRHNARACAAGPREVAAAAYSYLLRQLRYEDTDKPRILALLDGTRAAFEA